MIFIFHNKVKQIKSMQSFQITQTGQYLIMESIQMCMKLCFCETPLPDDNENCVDTESFQNRIW